MPKRKAAKKKTQGEAFSSALLRTRAVELLKQGMIRSRIAEQLGVHPATVTRWLSEAGVKPLPRGKPRTEEGLAAPAECTFNDYDFEEPEPDVFEEALETAATEAVQHPLLEARDAEEQDILAIAESQGTAADKYQAFVAATAIRMFRDSMPHIRGPRTVKEMSELDQLIRRNLGLNPRGGSGSAGSVQIDISILNNTKADVGGSAIPARNVTLDAEILNDDDDDED